MKKSVILATTLVFLVSSAWAIRIVPSTSDYNEAPKYRNGNQCENQKTESAFPKCDPSLVHIATTLDFKYLRGSIASVHSILKHAACPENVRLHFLTAASAAPDLREIVKSTFPALSFTVYPFKNEAKIKQLISSSIRPALEDPLNYARIYLSEILDPCIKRAVYVDSDTIVVDDIAKLWSTVLTGSRVIGAPVYCAANLRRYFSDEFWSDQNLSRALRAKEACYFNTGVMVMDLERWRGGEYTQKIEWWMGKQKARRMYELGSLPPLMLVFGGEVEGVDHRWNQHGLGGDNVVDSCRSLHAGPVSLMHWSGKGKPWVRLDQGRPCPIDYLWAPYDLYRFSKY